MAAKSADIRKTSHRSNNFTQNIVKNPKLPFAIALLVADSILVALIIAYVPYTKIDWDAYMSQVTGFLEGERDYSNLKGDTGPLVYPAGFLYIYSAIQYVTGGQVYPAQLKRRRQLAGTGMKCAICVNSCSCLYLSGAVSIKMNVLLYAPPLLLLMVKAMDIIGVISALAGAALVQIVIGLPFILSHPASYISNAFNLGRVFIHFWSVNFKFVPEDIFVSKAFALSLLVAHLSLLLVFAHYRWCKHEGGLFAVVHAKVIQLKLRVTQRNPSSTNKVLQTDHIVTTMFVGNFIGIICARSLHYQFYSCLLLFAAVEFCWNVFPSNIYSSVVLLCVHVIILGGLWISSSEYPYVEKTTDKSTSKKKTR
ncbi:putative rapid alkalinization factor-like [Capsicum annuum]|nr:putative rapid alkalinization factor-like [Capsicum annuum]